MLFAEIFPGAEGRGAAHEARDWESKAGRETAWKMERVAQKTCHLDGYLVASYHALPDAQTYWVQRRACAG